MIQIFILCTYKYCALNLYIVPAQHKLYTPKEKKSHNVFIPEDTNRNEQIMVTFRTWGLLLSFQTQFQVSTSSPDFKPKEGLNSTLTL